MWELILFGGDNLVWFKTGVMGKIFKSGPRLKIEIHSEIVGARSRPKQEFDRVVKAIIRLPINSFEHIDLAGVDLDDSDFKLHGESSQSTPAQLAGNIVLYLNAKEFTFNIKYMQNVTDAAITIHYILWRVC